MKSKLTRNLGLKIMAILFSVVLWMIAKDINDPVVSNPYYNVPVQLINTGSLTAKNKTYRVLGNTDTVRVTVSAPSSVLTNITKDNIVARADISRLAEDNTVPIEVSLNDKALESDVESIRTDKASVLLEIEDRRSEQLGVEVVQIGELPDGYTTGKIVTDTNTISISGPASAIEPVKRAVVEVYLDDVVSDVNMQTQIRLLDEDGNEVSNANIKKNIESIKVTVPIMMLKEIPISWQVTGTPEDGYVLTGANSCVPNTVVVAGKESALADVDGIEIPATELDVTDAQENVVRTVDIRKYLPANVALGDPDFNGNVVLTAEVEAIRRKTINITESTVPVLNVPDGWLAELVPGQNLRVTLRGLQRNLAEVTESTIQPHINVATILDDNGEITAGEHEVVVNFIIPDNVQQDATVRATIQLTRPVEE